VVKLVAEGVERQAALVPDQQVLVSNQANE
jgi:hypothetical protein